MVEENNFDFTDLSGETVDGKDATSAESTKDAQAKNAKDQTSKTLFQKGHKAVKRYEEKIKSLEEKLDELNDKYLRLFSEFDNYRKRTNKERLDLLKTASEDTIIGLLPVLDDFERAIAAMDKNGATGVDVDGIKLIYNKLLNILTKKGLESMSSAGQPFDTDFHEALTIIPAPDDQMKGKVIEEIEKGYLLNGKVIRFARVVVGQ
ncbi:MAG: nucleotide exchange factor GrpE [Bacteroidales bacterium]|nr:nucleotide exchange factor GrpE [Bacteroidales bacterium]